jgi:predicted alpha/beta hydrolase
VRAYCMADDRIAPRGQVEAYHAYYQRAQVEICEVVPAAYQQRSIGHIGFFAPKLKATLWQEHAAWWRSRTAAS